MAIIKSPRSKFAHGPGNRDRCQPTSGEYTDLVKTGTFLKNEITEPGTIVERSKNRQPLGEPMDVLETSTGNDIHSNETAAILEGPFSRLIIGQGSVKLQGMSRQSATR
jgi:hypothetical protein